MWFAQFKGAFWRGLGYRAARAAWALMACLGVVFSLMIAAAVWGHHLRHLHS